MFASVRSLRLFLVAQCIFFTTTVSADDEESFDEQRARAVSEGVAYLLRQQDDDGGWFPSDSPYGDGRTALCTLALIDSGVKPDDPALKVAVAKVLNFPEPKYTYTTALQTVILCRIAPADHRSIIERNVRWLEETQVVKGNRGAWNYTEGVGKGDGSNTRFAVWALHEAASAGVTVRPRVWKRAMDYWLNSQLDSGAWRYVEFAPAAGAITLDGIACVSIAARHLPGDKRRRQAADQAMMRAWEWLKEGFRVDRNPGDCEQLQLSHYYYYLHVLGAAARLADRDSIGNRDWRREATEMLLELRDPLGGGWAGVGHYDADRRIATSFALLFLAAAWDDARQSARPSKKTAD